MALYYDANGEQVEARQIQEDCQFRNGNTLFPAKRGEWLTRNSKGVQHIVETDYFSAKYRQVFPRPVGGDRVDVVRAPSNAA